MKVCNTCLVRMGLLHPIGLLHPLASSHLPTIHRITDSVPVPAARALNSLINLEKSWENLRARPIANEPRLRYPIAPNSDSSRSGG